MSSARRRRLSRFGPAAGVFVLSCAIAVWLLWSGNGPTFNRADAENASGLPGAAGGTAAGEGAASPLSAGGAPTGGTLPPPSRRAAPLLSVPGTSAPDGAAEGGDALSRSGEAAPMSAPAGQDARPPRHTPTEDTGQPGRPESAGEDGRTPDISDDPRGVEQSRETGEAISGAEPEGRDPGASARPQSPSSQARQNGSAAPAAEGADRPRPSRSPSQDAAADTPSQGSVSTGNGASNQRPAPMSEGESEGGGGTDETSGAADIDPLAQTDRPVSGPPGARSGNARSAEAGAPAPADEDAPASGGAPAQPVASSASATPTNDQTSAPEADQPPQTGEAGERPQRAAGRPGDVPETGLPVADPDRAAQSAPRLILTPSGAAAPGAGTAAPDLSATSSPSTETVEACCLEGDPSSAPRPPRLSLPAAPEPFRPQFDPSGAWLVQIGSYENHEASCVVWVELRNAMPHLFGDAIQSTERVTLADGRVVYRLRAGAFGARGAAEAFCEAYQAAGGACYVAQR